MYTDALNYTTSYTHISLYFGMKSPSPKYKLLLMNVLVVELMWTIYPNLVLEFLHQT